MPHLNWRRYLSDFDLLAEEIHYGRILNAHELVRTLMTTSSNDPAYYCMHLGVPSCVIGFLEYLFFRAEGPYSPDYQKYAAIISILFSGCEPLRSLINLNAADAIGNMVLDCRGRLKFTIADSLELDLVLQSWKEFGLSPVNRREIFDAILHKASIIRLVTKQDPGLILRLSEVFPEYLSEFWPHDLSSEELEAKRGPEQTIPSHRRYHRIYQQLTGQGISLEQMIIREESRILPLHARRNSLLAFLVKRLHKGRCQLCNAGMKVHADTPLTVHHIVPLSDGGDDSASNMLVVCSLHHRAIHQGVITVRMTDRIEISSDEGLFFVEPNRIIIAPEPG